MNTAEVVLYNNNGHYYSPVLARKNGLSSATDVVQKSPKKEKKWSIGSLFRLKKKPGSESSSEEEADNRFFLQRKKKKSEKRKPVNRVSGFDHVVIPGHNNYNGYIKRETSQIPSTDSRWSNADVKNHTNNYLPASTFTQKYIPLNDTPESTEQNYYRKYFNGTGLPLAIGSLGKRKKESVKARAEARRDTSNGGGESSDEGSQRSSLKSEESLIFLQDGFLKKKSRAARTQRYLKRIMKDEDGRDIYQTSKSDVETDNSRNGELFQDYRESIRFSSRTSPNLLGKSQTYCANYPPLSPVNNSGLCTIPPAHTSNSRYKPFNLKSVSAYKPNCVRTVSYPQDFSPQRSLSLEANIHASENGDGVIKSQLSLKTRVKPTNSVSYSQLVREKRQSPPPPPPRDPNRVLSMQNAEGRPVSYSFENGHLNQNNHTGHQSKLSMPLNSNMPHTFMDSKCRSTSEDQIYHNNVQRISLGPRPSSTTPDTGYVNKYPGIRQNAEKHDYRYLTDKNPRSRKPIFIQSCTNNTLTNQPSPEQQLRQIENPQSTFKFWKQKEEESMLKNQKPPESPRMFTITTQIRNSVFTPPPLDHCPSNEKLNERNTPEKSNCYNYPQQGGIDYSRESVERKSSNLEDALNELEAIYNSLHLGDEDLLDRAEQREMDAAQKRRDLCMESFPNSYSKGTLSDSSYGYDSFDSTRKKRHLRRTETDRKTDDMAFRKLHKKETNLPNSDQSSVSKISYLLTSPVFGGAEEEKSLERKNKSKEPDVTLDDVVYRNVKHINNTLKISDPQPPFGIPVGPISTSSSNDYLHAKPEEIVKKSKIPDIVKDDLAYRNLRKDFNKNYSQFDQNDFMINNKVQDCFKKKRAVRSLSANIFNLMYNETPSGGIQDQTANGLSSENIGDVADALELARQILKDKETKITAVCKAYLSDDEVKKKRMMDVLFNPSSVKNENKSKSEMNKINEGTRKTIDVNKNIIVDSPSYKSDNLDDNPTTIDELITSLSLETFDEPFETESSNRSHILNQISANKLPELTDSNNFVDSDERKFQKDQNAMQSSSFRQLLSEIDSFAEESLKSENILDQTFSKSPQLAAIKVESQQLEHVSSLNQEPRVYETVANIIISPTNKVEQKSVITEVHSDSDHDYVNLCQDVESKSDVSNTQTETTDKAIDSIDLKEKKLLDDVSADIFRLSTLLQQTQQTKKYKSSDRKFSEGCRKDRDFPSKDGDSIASSSSDCTNKKSSSISRSNRENIDHCNTKNQSEFPESYKNCYFNNELCLESLKAPKLVQSLSNLGDYSQVDKEFVMDNSDRSKDNLSETQNHMNCDTLSAKEVLLENNTINTCDTKDTLFSNENLRTVVEDNQCSKDRLLDHTEINSLGRMNSYDERNAEELSVMRMNKSCGSSTSTESNGSGNGNEVMPSHSWY